MPHEPRLCARRGHRRRRRQRLAPLGRVQLGPLRRRICSRSVTANSCQRGQMNSPPPLVKNDYSPLAHDNDDDDDSVNEQVRRLLILLKMVVMNVVYRSSSCE